MPNFWFRFSFFFLAIPKMYAPFQVFGLRCVTGAQLLATSRPLHVAHKFCTETFNYCLAPVCGFLLHHRHRHQQFSPRCVLLLSCGAFAYAFFLVAWFVAASATSATVATAVAANIYKSAHGKENKTFFQCSKIICTSNIDFFFNISSIFQIY